MSINSHQTSGGRSLSGPYKQFSIRRSGVDSVYLRQKPPISGPQTYKSFEVSTKGISNVELLLTDFFYYCFVVILFK